ncbi:MAG TPA: alpha/beta hydrolase [Mycobacterium sp.]|nr:alpha/beta hydrolase [Mycobacterium sp.]
MQLRYISIAALIAEAGGDPWAIIQSLQTGRPAQISELAQAFHAAGRCTTESSNAFDEARRRFEASWNRENGENPINDSAEVQRVTKSLGAQSLQLPKIGVDLENIAAALAEAQRTGAVLISILEGQLQQLDNEIGQAVQLEKDVDLSAADRSALDALIPHLEQQAIDDTKSALGQLQSVRDGYSGYVQKSLTTLCTDGYDPAILHALDAAPQIPLPDTKPEDVKKWWDSLSQEQKDQLIAQRPPELGNLNGIDAVVRDTVNQAVMNDDINLVENIAKQRGVSAADILANPGMYGLSATDATRYRNAVKTRDGLNYDGGPDGPNQRPVMLWGYDPLAFNGWGRAAIAIGNPDYARNTAVIVPGTGSSVAQGWMSGQQDAINLYDQSLAADPEHHYTSVIAWMGYEAPHGFSDLRVSEPGLARAGGDLLAADVNGLWVTHNSLTPEHIAVIGHSYGSTAVADAFAHSNMHATDAVLIGCPGTDLAHSAADFHLDGGHVYVGAASTDPVSWIGEGSGMPEQWLKGKVRQYGLPIPFDAGLGCDPAGDGYGSIRFHAEVAGSGEMDRHDHSHYYDMGSEALRSMTDIASGHSDHLATDGLLADGRRQPHIGPFRIPGIPAYIDPELDRPRDTILDNHAYRAYAPR